MFRKRNRTILEETLTNIGGIDVHSDVGRALLNKMIESFPKVSGGTITLSREANTTLNEAEIIAN